VWGGSLLATTIVCTTYIHGAPHSASAGLLVEASAAASSQLHSCASAGSARASKESSVRVSFAKHCTWTVLERPSQRNGPAVASPCKGMGQWQLTSPAKGEFASKKCSDMF
jgi:hypothetical protein